MQTSIRYYITRADDQPVVRTIPVALRQGEAPESRRPTAETPSATEVKTGRTPKIVRPTLRKLAQISSDKL